MLFVRLIGWLFMLAGFMALGADILLSFEAGAWTWKSLGVRWVEFFGFQSIQAIQVGLQRYTLPFLWDPVVQTLFEAPSWLPLIILGILLWFIGRRRRSSTIFS